jgi:hypothetical protein
MTALEAMAPMERWGYLYRYQADMAPGYDPPMTTQGLFFTPCNLLDTTCSVK